MRFITQQLHLHHLHHTATAAEKREVVGGVLRIAAVTDHVTCWKSYQSDAHLHTAAGSVRVCACVCARTRLPYILNTDSEAGILRIQVVGVTVQLS